MASTRERLVKLLRERGLSQAELARRVGEQRDWVNRRVTGRTEIAADDVPRLAEAMNVPVMEFFKEGGEEEEPLGSGVARRFVDAMEPYSATLAELERRSGPLTEHEIRFAVALLALVREFRQTAPPEQTDLRPAVGS